MIPPHPWLALLPWQAGSAGLGRHHLVTESIKASCMAAHCCREEGPAREDIYGHSWDRNGEGLFDPGLLNYPQGTSESCMVSPLCLGEVNHTWRSQCAGDDCWSLMGCLYAWTQTQVCVCFSIVCVTVYAWVSVLATSLTHIFMSLLNRSTTR